MRRTWLIWMVFGLCLAVAFASMGWISLTALRLDRAQSEAQRQALLEENVRLALWRMDSFVAPLFAQENARPALAYNSFYPVQNAYTSLFAPIKPGLVLMSSPLLTQRTPNVLLYFQISPEGNLTSPEVPGGNMQDLAEVNGLATESIDQAAARLAELQKKLDRERLLALLPPAAGATPLAAAGSPETPQQTQTARQQDEIARQRDEINRQKPRNPKEVLEQQAAQQSIYNAGEYQSRQRIAENTTNRFNPGNNEIQTKIAAPAPSVREGTMHAAWVGDALVLARRVETGSRVLVQGCWLDWDGLRGDGLRRQLLAEVKDLLPAARVEPIRAGSSDEPARKIASVPGLPVSADAGDGYGRRLAGLPVRLVPDGVPALPHLAVSPIRFALVIAWACVLLAAAAVAVLLRGAVVLSERRGAFVSAVTHEMRTPLTTFRMYSEMLAGGMVAEEKLSGYLETLRTEADRLCHLVENVLAYARLERGPAKSRIETLAAGDLLLRVRDRLAQRAAQADMQLVLEEAPDKLALRLRADPSAVEQILFNLVDNACKYAANGADRRIHIEVTDARGSVEFRIRDHGPGITPKEARRLFRPFRKSAHDAANSAPGVGLGLALSRHLARQMRGDLAIDHAVADGACFRITLPRA